MSFFKKSFEENIDTLRVKVSLKRKLQSDIIQKSINRDRFIKETNNNKTFFEKEGLTSMVKELDNKLEKSIKSHNESTIVDVAKIKKCDKEIISILKSDMELAPLLQYSDFVPEKKYINLLVTLTNAHKTGQIQGQTLLSLKEYSPLIIKGNTVYVKDNRIHYADMILVNDKNQILFTIRNKNDDFQPGKYCLPGGHVEKKEDPMFAAIRECQEETGITIDKDLVVEAGGYSDDKVVIHYYVAKFNGEPEVLEERELQQWEWVNIDDIKDKPLIANLGENFEKVISIPVEILTTPSIAGIMDYGDIPFFYKGMDVNLGIYNQEFDSIEDETFEKGGKNAQIGEIRTWKGVKEQKTADGWVPVKESGSTKKESSTEEKPSEGKSASFKEILANEDGKKLVEAIEHLDPKREDHKELYKKYQKELKDKFNYDYKDDSWDVEDNQPKKYSPEELDKFARQTSTEDLQTASEGADENIRIAAKRELERRQSEHKSGDIDTNPFSKKKEIKKGSILGEIGDRCIATIKEALERGEKEVSEALDHPNKLGAGAEKRKKLNPKDKFKAVMAEYGKGTLHSGDGTIVKDKDQAIAIAYSESGLKKGKGDDLQEFESTTTKYGR